MPSRHPILVAALTSLVAHAIGAAVLHWGAGVREPESPPDVVVDVDLDIAPEAPGAFDPVERAASLVQDAPAESPAEAAGPPGARNAEAESTLEPAPDEEAERLKKEKAAEEERRREEEKARAEARAKKAKERAERAAREREAREAREAEERARLAENASRADAGPEDTRTAAAESPADAGPGEVAATQGAGDPIAAAPSPSAGGAPAAPSPSASGAPVGTPPAVRGVVANEPPTAIGAGAVGTGSPAGVPGEPGDKLPPGASADLRTYAPDGDKLAVLLRYDRLRGTPWAALADAIIAPMPDYRSIIGDRKVALSELFQSLLISSRNPTNVTATHLVARTHLTAAEMRRFLDHKQQRVTWQAARGGALGRREASEVTLERDHRVYLMPFPGMVVLTAPRHLGVLVERPPGVSGRADLDSAHAAEADLPPWLAHARTVENEAGVDADVIAVVTVAGLRRAEIAVPELGALPTPERFSLALEMAKVGFYVRGTMAFDTPERAESFATRLDEGRKRLLASPFSQLMLKNLHAFHALQGLALRRRGALVTYATSISNADAKAAMKLVAEWARRYFEEPPAEAGGSEAAAHPGAPVRPASPRSNTPAVTPGAAKSPTPP